MHDAKMEGTFFEHFSFLVLIISLNIKLVNKKSFAIRFERYYSTYVGQLGNSIDLCGPVWCHSCHIVAISLLPFELQQ